MRPLTLLAALLACASTLATTVYGATYPERPIRYVVAFAPGAFNDILARTIAEPLSISLGKQVVVDNRAGAGGNVGAELVARASPDGYTLLNISSAHTIGQSLYGNLKFSLERDFSPVVLFAYSPLVMTVNPGLPVSTLAEFVAWAKGNRAVYASGGIGVISHLSVELFKRAAGIEATHVPYRGGGPGVLDVIAGRAHMMTNTLPTLLPPVKSGKLRALALMAQKRHASLPDVPTFAESGYKEFVMGNWLGIGAPAGTPPEVVQRLAAEVTRIVRMPEVQAQFRQFGADPVGGTPEQFAQFMGAEVARFREAVKAAGAKVD